MANKRTEYNRNYYRFNKKKINKRRQKWRDKNKRRLAKYYREYRAKRKVEAEKKNNKLKSKLKNVK